MLFHVDRISDAIHSLRLYDTLHGCYLCRAGFCIAILVYWDNNNEMKYFISFFNITLLAEGQLPGHLEATFQHGDNAFVGSLVDSAT